ncbi:MAG: hypothetical protein HQK89_17325 [Nitrospirae bacterium]|nr:hypothetical protein [Nitrospirota bacterium]
MGILTENKGSRRHRLKELSKLLADGERSPGWNLKDNVARAVKDGHTESEEFLSTLAAVIADEKPPACRS